VVQDKTVKGNNLAEDDAVKDNKVKDNTGKDNLVSQKEVKGQDSLKDIVVRNIPVEDASEVAQDNYQEQLRQAEARQNSAAVPFHVPSYPCLGKQISTTVGKQA
jgi:hypothetical protein